ncbi:hypothetical protein PtB15_17B431 [Puccinia triticina]|nr:hypothetical protein PtB15_17B431 [Puccinia triticina]
MHNRQPHNSSVVDYENHRQGKPLPTILTQRTSIAYCFHDRATCHSAESCQHWLVAFTKAKIRRKSTRPSHARNSAVLAIQDHPSNPHLIYTSSYDGTIRELNLESQQSMEVVDCQALSAKDNIFLSAFEFSNQDRKIWASNTAGGLVHRNRPPDIGLLPPLSFPAIDGFDFSLDLPCRAGPAGPAANNLPALPSSPPLPSSLSNIIHPLLALLAPLTSTPAPCPLASDQQPEAPPDKLSNALPTLMYPSLL